VILGALTYNGSAFDTIVNTVVLMVLIVGVALQTRWPWRITFVGTAVMQVALWFGLGATGISVVWSGLAGAALVDLGVQRRSARRSSSGEQSPTSSGEQSPRSSGEQPSVSPVKQSSVSPVVPVRRWMLRAAVVVAFAAIAYYAVVLPPISTVAHLLAVVVGGGIQAGARYLARRIAAPKVFQKEPGPFRLPKAVHARLLETWPDYRESDDSLSYETVTGTGLLISRNSDGFRVERRPERRNTYDELRFRTSSRRELHRRLLQE
jgi:hypothetical protein